MLSDVQFRVVSREAAWSAEIAPGHTSPSPWRLPCCAVSEPDGPHQKLSAYDGEPRGEALLEGRTLPCLDQLDASALEVDHVAGVHKIGLKKNMNGMGSLAEKGQDLAVIWRMPSVSVTTSWDPWKM